MSREFETWFSKMWRKFDGGILSDAPKHNCKLAWDYQQEKLENSKRLLGLAYRELKTSVR